MKSLSPQIAIIGGGPAGLMAAEILAGRGLSVCVFEQKPTPGRKFLMAGRGGLNLTHSEPLPQFLTRYREAAPFLEAAITGFTPQDLRAWCDGLGQKTFIGTSGRVFPESFKASPLLRAWQGRLESLGVRILNNHRWTGWEQDGALLFEAGGDSPLRVQPQATLLALGGASWKRLGSDGQWAEIAMRHNIAVNDFRPANCGFHVAWSDYFKAHHAGAPLKGVALSFAGQRVKGEMVITENGIEGGLVYGFSAQIRDAITRHGTAQIHIDLRPDISPEDLSEKLAAPRGRQSFSNILRKRVGLDGAGAALLYEAGGKATPQMDGENLAALIKNIPLTCTAPFSIERAISSAGGVPFTAINADYMLRDQAGVFLAGEMLDWEAPTGGYLLQATFSTAVAAAHGILRYLHIAP